MTIQTATEREIRKIGTVLKHKSGDRLPIASNTFLDLLDNVGNNPMRVVSVDVFLSDTQAAHPGHGMLLLAGRADHTPPFTVLAGQLNSKTTLVSEPNPIGTRYQAPLGMGLIIGPGEGLFIYWDTGLVDTTSIVSYTMVYSYQ